MVSRNNELAREFVSRHKELARVFVWLARRLAGLARQWASPLLFGFGAVVLAVLVAPEQPAPLWMLLVLFGFGAWVGWFAGPHQARAAATASAVSAYALASVGVRDLGAARSTTVVDLAAVNGSDLRVKVDMGWAGVFVVVEVDGHAPAVLAVDETNRHTVRLLSDALFEAYRASGRLTHNPRGHGHAA